MNPTDREMQNNLSQPLDKEDDDIMGFLAQDILESMENLDEGTEEAGSDMDDAMRDEEEEEVVVAGSLLDGMEETLAGQIRTLQKAKSKPRRTSSINAAAKLRHTPIEEEDPPSAAQDEEGFCEDDEGEKEEDGTLRHYGHEEEVPPDDAADQDDQDFVVNDPEGLVLDQDDEEFVDPEHRREMLLHRAIFLASMQKLREMLPKDTIIPDASTITTEHPDLNILFADERDLGDFCTICTRTYHELLLNITSSTTRKTTAIDKKVQDLYKEADARFKARMMVVGRNVMLRVSDRHFGQVRTEVQGVHPWYSTWDRLRHSVDLRATQDPVSIPADGYCCVTGKKLKKNQEAYLVGLVRKQLNDRASKGLYPYYMYVSVHQEPVKDAYLRFVQSAFTLWNYKARIMDWMKDWKAEHPLENSQADVGPGNLMGSERGRFKLGHHYLVLKTHAAYVEALLSKE